MIVKDILASAYVLLGNIDEDELPYIIALEQFGNVWSKMKFEQILGNRNELLHKVEVDFPDETGRVENTLTDYGDVVFLRFNNSPIDEAPTNMLDIFKDSGRQGVSFWTDAEDNTKYIELAVKSKGTLEIWYEPNNDNESAETETIPLNDNLRYCLALRLALQTIPYVIYKNPAMGNNKPALERSLYQQVEGWTQDWLEKINKIGTGRAFQRIPFQAS
jgi:hypothetical protein